MPVLRLGRRRKRRKKDILVKSCWLGRTQGGEKVAAEEEAENRAEKRQKIGKKEEKKEK